jgi:hypothetical protein
MHSGKLPTCLVKQITKMRDCKFLAVEQSHHLWFVEKSAQVTVFLVRFFLPTRRHNVSLRSRDQN